MYVRADELVEKISDYLDSDDERRAIGRAGRERTLRGHGYGRRMEDLLSILDSYRIRI